MRLISTLVIAAMVTTSAVAAPTDQKAETGATVMSDTAIEAAIRAAMPLPVVSIIIRDIGRKERFSVNMDTSALPEIGPQGFHVNFEVVKKAPPAVLHAAINGAATYAQAEIAKARRNASDGR